MANPSEEPTRARHLDEVQLRTGRQPLGSEDGEPARVTAPAMPDRIGPYEIVRVIGEGGMGVVYEGLRLEPVRQRVAIKVVQGGLATKHALARFELERRALAAMEHEAIAKVLDAGETEHGQPYFVMELIEGAALAEHCDGQRLDLRARIELMCQVCRGVQHAHQKGIIHRDLKSGNVLVFEQDGRHVVKILDFGLAKATNCDFLDAPMLTARDAVVGTPQYMSPEQAAGLSEVVDIRTDVYSLGVMLYELLTGALPFSTQKLRDAGQLRALHMVISEEPPRPSTRVSAAGESSREAAESRRTTVVALGRQLRGDLDWIVMRAMAKEPERRYGSAADLAADLMRYLAHEPVLAGPPGPGYRLRKFVRRHRLQTMAALLVFAALVVGVIGTAVGLAEARRQASVADARAKEVAAQKTTIETTAAQLAQRTGEFELLKGFVRLERAREVVHGFDPAWPDKIAAIEAWKGEHVEPLERLLPELDATLAALRRRALVWTPAEQQHDRETHPRRQELLRLRAEVESLAAAAAVRAGAPYVPLALPPALAKVDTQKLVHFAFARVVPNRERRKIWGEERAALAAAEAGLARDDDADIIPHDTAVATLVYALVATGQEDRARELLRAEASKADPAVAARYAAIGESVDRAVQFLATLPERRAALEKLTAEISARRTWRFEQDADRFLFDALSTLRVDIAAFFASTLAEVETRLRWARFLAQLAQDPAYLARWQAATAAIAKADGIVASTLYRVSAPGEARPLPVQDGLVPIGMNPVTKLWEFYHLRSAWEPDSTATAADIEVPSAADFDARGGLPIDGRSGIVFVLIPGGRFLMGSQEDDAGDPNYDPAARTQEGPIEWLDLRPFLLSKYELTQGQWRRLTGGEAPSSFKVGLQHRATGKIGWAHPVEQVSWPMCDGLMRRFGLTLPTEAQWEYAGRAGTDTPWSTGRVADSLAGFANVLDRTARDNFPEWGPPDVTFDDGYGGPAPVGTFAPNPWGLFDVHGNVAEWCRDGSDGDNYLGPWSDGDGERPVDDASRCGRGGSYTGLARHARSAAREVLPLESRESTLGLRAARTLR